MRKSIRLTGRKQLQQSNFTVSLAGEGAQIALRLDIADDWDRSKLPPDAEIKIKLVENKFVEVLHLGTIALPAKTAPLTNSSFRAPSCQLRIVSRDEHSNGLLLASTKAWTLKSAGDPEGILLFKPADIQPRLWKLEIRAQEHPILYVDERIPNAAHWAKTDPVFAACVLPHIVSEVLREVLAAGDITEGTWEADWVRWAETFVPGSSPPFDGDDLERDSWVDDLVDAFSRRHELARKVILTLEGES